MDPVTLGMAKADAKKKYAPRVVVSTQIPSPSLQGMPSGRGLAGIFASGKVLAVSSFGLSQSTDYGSNWVSKSLPSDAGQTASALGAAWAVEFKGKVYLQGKNTSGVPTIWRADPVTGATDFTWSSALFASQATSGANVITTGLACDADYLYWCDYGDPVPGARVYRSSDGTTWSSVLGPGTFTARHCHGVFPDPYNAGHVWMSCGDVGSAGYVYKSTNNGATWTAVVTDQPWQCVQLSFTATHVYAAADVGGQSLCAWRMDRNTLTPEWIARTHHRQVAVPGAAPSRRVTDLVTTAGSATITSATASFTSADVGSRVRTKGLAYLPSIAYIGSVTNSTTAVLKQNATFSGTGITAIVEGESWGVASYYGAVDPATGIFYYVSINGSFGGNVDGLFAIYPSGELVLIDTVPASPDCKVAIFEGRLWVHGVSRPLLSI